MKEQPKKRNPIPDVVEESNSIGADAGDATSGTPESPEEWAREQPLEEWPTYPLDAGDPPPFQPGAGSPEAEDPRGPLTEEEEATDRSG